MTPAGRLLASGGGAETGFEFLFGVPDADIEVAETVTVAR